MVHFLLEALGFVTGLWATKFDHTATITNFIITPLAFLSGVFYTIDKLPSIFQTISYFNPFFHIINIFRYGFLGVSDGEYFFWYDLFAYACFISMVYCIYAL